MVLSFGSDQLGVGGLLLSQLCFIPSFALLAIAESLVEAISSQLAPRLLWPYRVSRPRLPLLYLQHLSDMIHCGNRPHDSHNATYISCCLMRQQKKKNKKHMHSGGHKHEIETALHFIGASDATNTTTKKIPRRRSQKIAVAH